MTKILVLCHQPKIDGVGAEKIFCFYESFVNELKNYGSDVKVCNTRFLKDYWNNSITNLSQKDSSLFIDNLKKFNPDIIFTFNNQITIEIINNTNCPICLLDADGFDFFPNKNFIQEYHERYYLFSFYKGWEEQKYLDFGINKNRIYYLELATSIINENKPKTQNISFIGSKFGEMSIDVQNTLLNKQDLYSDLKYYYSNQYEHYNNFIKKYSEYSEMSLYPLLDTRCYVLESIWDLGLKIYGVRWDKCPSELFNLNLCFDRTPKYTLKHNQDIYNSSLINISISHPQCKGYAFPWRIYDIMASNGLLISSYSKLLEEKTKGFVNLPMYKSPYEARELCKYALENPNYSKDIIAESNEYINKFGRWKNNLERIQQIVSVKLINEKVDNNSKVDIYQFQNVKNNKEKKNRLKNIFYGLLLVFSSLPILDLFFTKKIKSEIYKKINKYKIL